MKVALVIANAAGPFCERLWVACAALPCRLCFDLATMQVQIRAKVNMDVDYKVLSAQLQEPPPIFHPVHQ